MKRKSLCNEKRCNSKVIWMRYFKKEKITRKTKEREEKNETILKSFTSIRSFCKSIEKINKNIKVIRKIFLITFFI
jgi:hypothetical protein